MSRDERSRVPATDHEPVRRYRVSKFRVALVREGTIPVAEKVVREPADVARLMTPLVADLDREVFWVLLLDGKNKIIGINLVALGSLTACLVHSREVFKPAVVGSAAAVVLVHNHPSQQPEPSAEDVALTERLRAAGALLGINVLDHVIVTAEGRYHSLANDAERGGAAPSQPLCRAWPAELARFARHGRRDCSIAVMVATRA